MLRITKKLTHIHMPPRTGKKQPVETRQPETPVEELETEEPEIEDPKLEDFEEPTLAAKGTETVEEENIEEAEIEDPKLEDFEEPTLAAEGTETVEEENIEEAEIEEQEEPGLNTEESVLPEAAAAEDELEKPREKQFINCSVSPGTPEKQPLKVAIPQAVWDNISAQSTHQYAVGLKPYKPCAIVLIRVQKVPFCDLMGPDEYKVTPREYPMTESCVKKDITFPSDVINNIDEEVAFNKANNLINDNRSAVITHRLLKTWFKKPEEASSGIK
jgi:hypothetical protein